VTPPQQVMTSRRHFPRLQPMFDLLSMRFPPSSRSTASFSICLSPTPPPFMHKRGEFAFSPFSPPSLSPLLPLYQPNFGYNSLDLAATNVACPACKHFFQRSVKSSFSSLSCPRALLVSILLFTFSPSLNPAYSTLFFVPSSILNGVTDCLIREVLLLFYPLRPFSHATHLFFATPAVFLFYPLPLMRLGW